MPEKSRSGRSCKNHSFLAFYQLPVLQERKRLLRPASQNWDTTEENACLCVENSSLFLLSQLCTTRERFCPTRATSSAWRAERLVFSTSYFFTFSGLASFSRPTLEIADTGTAHAPVIVAPFEAKESSVFLDDREGFHDFSLPKTEGTSMVQVPSLRRERRSTGRARTSTLPHRMGVARSQLRCPCGRAPP
jgi:hypothetical protein